MRQAAQRLFGRYKRDNQFTDQGNSFVSAEQHAATNSGQSYASRFVTNNYATQLAETTLSDEINQLVELQPVATAYGRNRKENLRGLSEVIYNTSYLQDAIDSALVQVSNFSVRYIVE